MTGMRLLISLLIVVSAAALAKEPDPIRVSQRDRAILPGTIEIGVGDAVMIVNDDRFVHRMQTDKAGLGIRPVARKPGDYLELRFAEQGIYDLHCALHPEMKLTVRVR